MALTEGLIVSAGKGFLDTISPALKAKFEKGLQKINWQTSQAFYYEKIANSYGTTRILGKPEPISLEGIFTDVYLLDEPTAIHRFDILQLEKDPDVLKRDQEWISGLELVKEGRLPRLYILGKPGAGKTTFLKYIALKASQNEIKKIPIFISLKEWADSDLEFMPFLVKQFDICQFPDAQPLIEYILEMGLAIVLFDGLDETQQEAGKRDQIINSIRDFSRKFTNAQILITCRIAATDFTFEEFTYFEVADFTAAQVNTYVENWFAYDEDKQSQFKKEFAGEDNERLRELASTPLLLSLLCLSFEQTGYFPQRRVEIYEEGINALLTKWDATRNIKRDGIYKGLELGRKRQMFARIAAQIFERNEYFLPRKTVMKMIIDYLCQLPDSPAKEDIDGEAVLKAIEAQHSIFVERAQNIYSFSHLTFQEYFAAKYAVDNIADGTLRRLLHKENLTDIRWHEVILNTASLLDNGDSLINQILEAAHLLVSNDEKIGIFLKWVNAKTQSLKINTEILKANYFHINVEFFLDEISKEFSVLKSEPAQEGFILSNKALLYKLPTNSFMIREHSSNSLEKAFLTFMKEIKARHKSEKFNLTSEISGFLFDLDTIYRNVYLQTDFKEFKNEIFLLSKKLANEETIIQDLLEIGRKYLNIGYQWNLSEKQKDDIYKYMRINYLLADCLKLSVLSNRKDIENKRLADPD